ncbi:MAG: SusC/RagA family TonB-linked outer membrane protein [Chitinophagaceae bacterium]|nr:SusC/RagA family TonB-linked outer membrane protein [Chitinophagaceae bacterium]MCW5928077.1 SusC/RagA family TonB-linked outer membrane protein [Chitinophagaceae bacterium]
MKKRLLPKLLLLFYALFITSFFVRGQSSTISGVVLSAAGDPLAGVSVTVPGTTIGTVTDEKGKYTLSVPGGNSKISFSFTGYVSQTLNVGGRSAINISLEESSDQLSEVVVTSLGMKKERRSLGYSIQELDGSKLTTARETNVINSLKGQIAGVHVNSSSAGPSGSAYIAIRGNSSLSGNNQPLFVVDGIPINNENIQQATHGGGRDFGDGVKDINPDDIETISVLKGPNAAALYGSRGANGVVVITTKKGTRKGIGVSLNSNATFETANSVPTFQNKWGVGYGQDFSQWGKVTIDGVEYDRQLGGGPIDNWGPEMDGRMIQIQALSELGLVPFSPQPESNIMEFYRTGETFTNTASVSAANEKVNFRGSVSGLSNKGIVPNNSFNRQSANIVVGANITDRLYVEGKANYIRQDTRNRPLLGGNRENIVESINWTSRNIDLEWLKDYKYSDGTQKSYNWQGGWPLNPYWIINEFENHDRRDRLIGYMSLNYKFTNWLSIKLRSGMDFYTDARFDRKAKRSPNAFGGSVNTVQYNVNEANSDVLLTAAGKLSGNFTGSFSAGANRYTYRMEGYGSNASNLNLDDIYTPGNAATVFGTFVLTRKQINSVYASGQLGYKNYLFLDLAARNDWSSTLSKGNYSFLYPSVSLSYVFTDALNINSQILNYGKVRLSWAQAGSDGSPYQTRTGYSIYTRGYNNQPFAWISGNIPAVGLKNELKTSWEVGTELRLFKNRMSIDFTYYDASTSNQIMNVQIPAATGFASKLVNSGEVRNRGIELFVSGRPIVLKNSFTWEATLNFSRNKSRIVSLYPGIETRVLYSTSASQVGIEARPGEPYGNIIGHPYLRTADGRLLLDANGIVQRDPERKILGNIQPDWLAGFTNTFSFKRVILSGLIDIRQGGQIYSMSKYRQMAGGTGKFTEKGDNLVNDGVIDDGNGGYKQSDKVLIREQYYASNAWGGIGEPFVLSASYAALRELSLGYDFKASLLSKVKISSARLSVVGRNLLYLYRDPSFKIMGISPEGAFAPTAVAQGYEAATLPTTRSVGFNLLIGF